MGKAMSESRPLNVILGQIKAAKVELDNYPPSGMGWYNRCLETANILVPWLIEVAPKLKVFVEEVVNSKELVRDSWKRIKASTKKHIPSDLLEAMDRELDREAFLLAVVSGDIISKVVEKFLIENFPNAHLESNGRSDYPDLFSRAKDYSGLPIFGRKGKEYGAALKGETRRPVRVPDGLEIKTCKGNRLAVDCHHAHAGLHLALMHDGRKGSTEVSDIKAAFMRLEDYRITKPSTPTTTLKASFNDKNFVSLLNRRLF
jgi:hypothetical protein